MVETKAFEWLNGNQLSYDIWNNKYRYNNESFDEWLDRVSGGDERIRALILAKKFLFGGRTLSNRGTNKGSFSNCYSIGYVPDSLDGIMDVNTKIAQTFKSQGGQGLSLSKIRPKGALIHGEFKSDGIVPFMEIFNRTTESISQGGSRKGALMMSLDINHPEAETFMTIKSNHDKINKANLSVEIDDDFMNKVLNGNLEANRLFNILSEQACHHAEPGVIFTNRFRNYNLMELVDEYQIETCNPCGEQPLPKHGACNLSSINISEYVKRSFSGNAYFDFKALQEDVKVIVRAMDDVLEENLPNHALDEQRQMAKTYRNVGIGIMGLHDALIKHGLKYGSLEAQTITEAVMTRVFRFAVLASTELALERGNFPGYSDKVWDSLIMKHHFSPEELETLKRQGALRNCSLLSIAPTGSIGTMLCVSTGCEPFFDLEYWRKTVSLNGEDTFYKCEYPVVIDAKGKNHTHCLVVSQEISWKNRIEMQASLQDSVDTAISSTINLPKGTTPEEVRELYIYAWQKGLKGVTIFVDGSRDPILSTTKEDSNESGVTPKNSLNAIIPVTRDELGQELLGLTQKFKTACGTLYVTTNFDKDGNIVEVFTNSSKNGTCKANLNGETRMASLALRCGCKVDEVVDQLSGIKCQACMLAKSKNKIQIDGISCPDIIATALKKAAIITLPGIQKTCECHKDEDLDLEECPECHKKGLARTGGCKECKYCGYSACNL